VARLVHPLAGALALGLILSFWLSTAASELSGSVAAVVAVKTAIPWGFLLLVPALGATGGSGMRLAGWHAKGPIRTKLRRTRAAAANGVLVLVPAALFLAARARAGTFDVTFYTVQVVELAAGATNIALLGLNMRDGLRLARRRRTAIATASRGQSGQAWARSSENRS
jgi:hypothetical protein